MGRGGFEDFNLVRVGVPENFSFSVPEILPLRMKGENLKHGERRIRTPVSISYQILSLARLTAPASPQINSKLKKPL